VLNFPSLRDLESFVVAAFIDMKILLDFVFFRKNLLSLWRKNKKNIMPARLTSIQD
jgi:hypothetical protein